MSKDPPVADHSQVLGKGVYGTVYYCRREKDEFALKIQKHRGGEPFSPEWEFAMLRTLKSPFIPKAIRFHVLSAEKTGIAMEWVPGTTLEKRMKEPVWSPSLLSSIGRQLLLMLQHAGPIHHNDLKTANLMITPAWMVKAVDWGIASADWRIGKHPQVCSAHTRAPEHFLTDQIDPKGDLWSIGIILASLVLAEELFQPILNYSTDLEETRLFFKMMQLIFQQPWPESLTSREKFAPLFIENADGTKSLSSLPDPRDDPVYRKRGERLFRKADPALFDVITALTHLDSKLRPTPDEILSAPFFKRVALFTFDPFPEGTRKIEIRPPAETFPELTLYPHLHSPGDPFFIPPGHAVFTWKSQTGEATDTVLDIREGESIGFRKEADGTYTPFTKPRLAHSGDGTPPRAS